MPSQQQARSAEPARAFFLTWQGMRPGPVAQLARTAAAAWATSVVPGTAGSSKIAVAVTRKLRCLKAFTLRTSLVKNMRDNKDKKVPTALAAG